MAADSVAQIGTGSRRAILVAIDGPAGAGKSTLAAHLARRFGLLNLETGAMYRALALKAIENALDLDEEASLLRAAAHTRIALEPSREGNRVLLDGVDVTRRVREPDVSAAASRASVHPAVRAWMVKQQRVLGAAGGVVMEGRDIGTVVFPDAELKIFLDADPAVRGERRFRQLSVDEAPPPQQASRDLVLAELRERDRRDRARAESPLQAAEDAVVIDSTQLSLEQLLERAEALVLERLGKRASVAQT